VGDVLRFYAMWLNFTSFGVIDLDPCGGISAISRSASSQTRSFWLSLNLSGLLLDCFADGSERVCSNDIFGLLSD
jgi:hypothetical protein